MNFIQKLFRRKSTMFFAHFRAGNGREYHEISTFKNQIKTVDEFHEWLVLKLKTIPDKVIITNCKRIVA